MPRKFGFHRRESPNEPSPVARLKGNRISIGPSEPEPSLEFPIDSSSTAITSHPSHHGEPQPKTVIVNPTISGHDDHTLQPHGSQAQDQLGLHLVRNVSDPCGDIIFVHGLGGMARKTWCWDRNLDYFWPPWLGEEDELSAFRIFTFGYNSNFKGAWTNLSVLDFAKDLLFHMLTFSEPDGVDQAPLGHRPIIFIAHSMGGLVVKKAFVLGMQNPEYADIVSRVHGIVFLATPHRGAQYAKTLNYILSTAPFGTSSKAYVADLDIHSATLQEMNEQFCLVCGNLALVSFFETLKTSFGITKILIVEKESGILGFPQEIASSLNADHHTVCKFRNRQDPNYISVRNILKLWAIRIQPIRPLAHMNQMVPEVDPVMNLFIREPVMDELNAVRRGITQGAGIWLTQRQDYVDWVGRYQDSSGSKVYYLTGPPATGKSCLAAVVIGHLQSLQKDCQYHFFSPSHQAKRRAAYCLRSIASQLAQTSEEFRQRLLRLNEESGLSFITEDQSFNMIWEKIFEGIIFKISFPSPLFWVLDAVDETESPLMLINHLLRVQSLSPIRLFLTSRPMKIPSAFTENGSCVSTCVLTEQDTLGDIRAYVHSVVLDALPNNGEIQEDICNQLLMKASGSFLWVKLALKTLQDSWHTQDDIRKALTEVPREMEELYEKMLKNVESQPLRLQLMAKRILTWASCCWRPLSIAELEVALEPEFKGYVKLQDTIVQICGHFTSVENSTISLIHFTARQFLLEGRNGGPAFIQSRYGHEHIAGFCLKYLSTNKWRRVFKLIEKPKPIRVQNSRVNRLLLAEQDHPFLCYAAYYWAYHVSESVVGSQDILQSLQSFLDRYSLTWVEAIALSGNLHALICSAQHLKAFAKRMLTKSSSNTVNSPSSPKEPPEINAKRIQMWANDFVRIVGKFSVNLVQSPSSVHRLVAPFCPPSSMIGSKYSNTKDGTLSIIGLHSSGWDDCLACVSVGQDQLASKVLATDMYFVTLISIGGTVIIWHGDTCEEARRMHHKEYVSLMSLDRSYTGLATAGTHTYRVWNISSGKELYCLPKVAQARTMALVFGKADSELVIGLDDCTITCYNLETADISWRFLAQSREFESLGCPRIMAFNPDVSEVAMAWRGKAPMVWHLRAGETREPEQCKVCPENHALYALEKIEWQKDGNSMLILCQDTTLLEWRLYDDDQIEFDHVNACQMTISADGSLLLTSDSTGTMSVWAFPRLYLIYRLMNENEFIWDLTFSPNAQRFYDLRQSTCHLWEPDTLVRPDGPEMETEDQSTTDRVLAMTDAVISRDQTSQSLVTALAIDSKDQYYCCGREDGTVIIHDAAEGRKIRKVYSHGPSTSVIVLAWSPSGQYIISSDDSSRVVAKRLVLKEAAKWGVYPVFDFRVNEAVQQILVSADEKMILISTSSKDLVWGLKEKNELCRRQWVSRHGRRWVGHPLNPELLVRIDATGCFHTCEWATLKCSNAALPSPVASLRPAQDLCSMQTSTRADTYERPIQWISVTKDKRYLVYEVIHNTSKARTVLSDGLQLQFLSTSDLSVYHPHLPEGECMADLTVQVRRLIGTFEDSIVFLDRSYWLSTWKIDTSVHEVKRHFFLPRDWLNVNTLQMATLNAHGTFFFPKHGDVATVRNGMKL